MKSINPAHGAAVFWLLAVGYLLSLTIERYSLQFVFKALPVLFLLLFYRWQNTGKLHLSIVGALVFSALGDVLLALNFEHSFVFGLGAFLIAQICYQSLFWRLFNWSWSKAIVAVSIIVGAAFVYWLLMPNLAELRWPVLIYITVLTAMALSACFAGKQIGLAGYGALSFLVSDSLIAWDKFIAPIEQQAFFIMTTYYIAQYLLVQGAIRLTTTKLS